MKKRTFKRVLTPRNVMDAKIPRFNWDGEWEQAFGHPESRGIWYVWGGSGSGKTTFILMLIKKLAETGRVHFISHEEGTTSASLQDGFERLGMTDVNRRVGIIVESIPELDARLSGGGAVNYVIIDSLESMGVSVRQMAGLVDKYTNKLFVFIGQADGRNPASKVGREALFLANQKIWVEGYRAFSRGRSFGEGKSFAIWEREAAVYWVEPGIIDKKGL
jgi:hypothetical protein